ncbi:hypothetical protein tb265_35330 [Gemmatimonadetes bacterium T265]|nr:hypothetical protein tb265_35330 [Gemmatimonadetes bacterium T265]
MPTRTPSRTERRTPALAALVAAGAALAGACGPSGPPALRAWTDSYEFRITADPSPPRARETTLYRVVVLDKKTHQVIDHGEGQIFASSQDRANVYDSFTPAPEAGTYTARMSYITAGDWRVGVRFRRDSTAKLERIEDWVQTVYGARPVGERPIQ